MPLICPQCGYENKDETPYCGLCYTVLIKKNPLAFVPVENKKKPIKNIRQFILLICLLLIIAWQHKYRGNLPTNEKEKTIAQKNNIGETPEKTLPANSPQQSRLQMNIMQDTIQVPTPSQPVVNIPFSYYIPQQKPGPLPILVCPGFDPYRFAEFAEKNGFIIVSPSFPSNFDDWQKRMSFQFPAIWSGNALLQIIEKIKNVYPVKEELYLMGLSANAQFVHRFAIWRPDLCKAVAFHAPGGITVPQKWIPVQFLITVGEMDIKDRKIHALHFTEACKILDISVTLITYPGVGHTITEAQIQESLNLFLKNKGEF